MVVPPGHPRIDVRNDADLPHGCRGFRHGRTRIFRAGGRDLPRRPVRIQVENSRNQKANFVHNNAEGSRNTSQGSLELSL